MSTETLTILQKRQAIERGLSRYLNTDKIINTEY